MSLKTRIQNDINEHMKARRTFETQTLRLVMGDIQTAEKSGKTPKEFSDIELNAFLAKQVKTRRDTAGIYAAAGETNRAEKETAEADLIATYLPEGLDEAVVTAIIERVIASLGNPTLRERGQVMKAVNAEVKGRFDGKTLSEMVFAKLS